MSLVFQLGRPILTTPNPALAGLALLTLALQSGRPHAASPTSSPFVRWLITFGPIGIFAIAFLDSSIFPLPIPGTTDLLLLLLAVHPGTSALHLAAVVALALAGSLIGGYLTWNTGRKGGMPALEKHVPARIRRPIERWVKQHGALAVFGAAVLPPPIPLTPFLLAAGTLGVSRGKFLAFFGAARATRYGLVAWLGFHYGHQVVHFWNHSLSAWSKPILFTFIGLVTLAVLYVLFKFLWARRDARPKTKAKPHNRRQPAR